MMMPRQERLRPFEIALCCTFAASACDVDLVISQANHDVFIDWEQPQGTEGEKTRPVGGDGRDGGDEGDGVSVWRPSSSPTSGWLQTGRAVSLSLLFVLFLLRGLDQEDGRLDLASGAQAA